MPIISLFDKFNGFNWLLAHANSPRGRRRNDETLRKRWISNGESTCNENPDSQSYDSLTYTRDSGLAS